MTAKGYAAKYQLIKVYNTLKKLEDDARDLHPYHLARGTPPIKGRRYLQVLTLLKLIREEEIA